MNCTESLLYFLTHFGGTFHFITAYIKMLHCSLSMYNTEHKCLLVPIYAYVCTRMCARMCVRACVHVRDNPFDREHAYR